VPSRSAKQFKIMKISGSRFRSNQNLNRVVFGPQAVCVYPEFVKIYHYLLD